MRYFRITLDVALDDYTEQPDPNLSALDAVLSVIQEECPEVQVIAFAEEEHVLVNKELAQWHDLVEQDFVEPQLPMFKQQATASEIDDAFLEYSDRQADALKDAIVEQEITEQK